MGFFTRITTSDDSCLVRKAMYVQRSLLSCGKPCWLNTFKDTLSETTCGTHIWNDWWSMSDFRCNCMVNYVDSRDGRQALSSISWQDSIEEATKAAFVSTWKNDLMHVGIVNVGKLVISCVHIMYLNRHLSLNRT